MCTCYETFVMEIRPRLQCCNVFIILKNSGEKVSIKLREKEILICGENIDSIKVTNFNILVNSLSSLQVSNTFVSFRFQTENIMKITGQFKTEFLIFDTNKQSGIIANNLLNPNTSYIIKCSNCQINLTDEIHFKRILPLPSENVQPSDWFCHKSEDITILKLSPNINDCFYGNCYVHVNKNILNNLKISTNSVIVCKRCLFWLGLELTSNTVQFWFNTVIFQSKDTNIHSNPLNDFALTIKGEIQETILSACKILFECNNQNNKEYLCVWILEKNLQLSIKNDKFKNADIINVAKVLFHFNTQVTDTISEWLNDANVNHIKISKPMMIYGLNHLYEMCNLIPTPYRKSNIFFVSYVVT